MSYLRRETFQDKSKQEENNSSRAEVKNLQPAGQCYKVRQSTTSAHIEKCCRSTICARGLLLVIPKILLSSVGFDFNDIALDSGHKLAEMTTGAGQLLLAYFCLGIERWHAKEVPSVE